MGTVIALILGVTTEPRALQLVGALWAVYGLVAGFTSGVLEPVVEQDAGRAMAELRRLIDRHPTARDARRLRVALAELKSRRFAEPRP